MADELLAMPVVGCVFGFRLAFSLPMTLSELRLPPHSLPLAIIPSLFQRKLLT